MNSEGLVYLGKIVSLYPIEGADFIVSATVICGKGGKWRGVVRKEEFLIGSECTVFLPDAQLNKDIHSYLPFMENSNWRVRMRRFKGAPSEVLITKPDIHTYNDSTEQVWKLGLDITEDLCVKKYQKPIPPNLQGKVKGEFPSFVPKTDEPNYQTVTEMIEALKGKSYYITEKADGSSSTAYKYKGQFGVCSRNWELERDENNGYWQVAIKYNLENKLPEGYAIQWETCGPKIQGNPMGWNEIQGLMFSAYNIEEQRYCTFIELCSLSQRINFPMVMILNSGSFFNPESLETIAEGNYDNGKPREGVVIRSTENLLGNKPISFKVINLNYEN